AAQALYDIVVARYSSSATTALGHLLLPYLFPELSAFATVEDLISHLRASDARYCTAALTEFLERNQPPMFITVYFIVTRLHDSLRCVWDHFLSLDPTSLTVHLLKQHLLAAETSAVAVGAAHGIPRPPFFEGCSPSPLAPSYASAAAADVSVAEDVGAAYASAQRRTSKSKGGRGGGDGSGGGGGGSGTGGGGSRGGDGGGGTGGGSGGSSGGGGGSGGSDGSGGSGTGGGGTSAWRVGSEGGQRKQQHHHSETQSPQQLREWFLQRGASGGSGSCTYVIHTGDRASQTCGRLHTLHRCFSCLDDAWRAEFGDDAKLPRWADLLKYRIAIFDLDFDAILSAMYALSISAEGDCYLCVPPDPGASRCFFCDSTPLTPLPAPVPVTLADPSGGPVMARSSTTFPCLAVPSGSLSGLHIPSFSTNLGRAVDFEVWLDDLQLFLQCDSKDGLSLFDLTSGASTAPTTDADRTVRSYLLALYDAVVARYSSPTTAALSRLMLPYLFPDLAAFATVADLVAHLCTSDARYRAALPTEFLPTNSPPMYITLYYLVTRLPDSLSSVRDHFLSLLLETKDGVYED
ncbi:unnamed protein product, partial [Closterium sp. NIES-53]